MDLPPYEIQPLIASILDEEFDLTSSGTTSPVRVLCAQALGSEIYVGCSNGELLRFAIQADDPNKLASYALLSRQSLPSQRAIIELVLVPSISRVLILSDHQIHFYTFPSLDPVQSIKPIRNVVTFAVDHEHLLRPPQSLSGPSSQVEPVDISVIKRGTIALYTLRVKLVFQKEIPLPEGATLARRTGSSLCVADKENYNVVDLEKASILPILPLSQAPETSISVKPSITVVSQSEFLILSWTGGNTLGVFISGEGDPIRGTLEWPSHPESVCLDYPYITTLLPNNTIEIHNVETQSMVQTISAPNTGLSASTSLRGRPVERQNLVTCLNGYLVPSSQASDKMQLSSIRLVRPDSSKPKQSEDSGPMDNGEII